MMFLFFSGDQLFDKMGKILKLGFTPFQNNYQKIKQIKIYIFN